MFSYSYQDEMNNGSVASSLLFFFSEFWLLPSPLSNDREQLTASKIVQDISMSWLVKNLRRGFSSLRVDEDGERNTSLRCWLYVGLWLSQGGIGTSLSSISSSSSDSSDTTFGMDGEVMSLSLFNFPCVCSVFNVLGSVLHLGGILLVFLREGGVRREFSKFAIVAVTKSGVVMGDANGVDAPLRSEWLYMSESVEGYPCRRCGENGREFD